MGGDHDSRRMSRGVPRGAVEHAGLASPTVLDQKAGTMCYVVKPAAVSGVDHTRRWLLLTKTRVAPLTGGRFSVYARFVGNDDGGSNNLRSTIVLNGILILATIFTTNLPVVTNMLRKPKELDTECGQNEMPSVARRTSPEPGEEVPTGNEELGEPNPPESPLTLSHGFGPPETPPPKMALPRLPRGSVVPMKPAWLRQPPLPPPLSRSKQLPLTSWPSRSTLQEPWDGGSTHSAHGAAVPPRVWSSFD